jgi:hypothetical protein
MNIEASFFSLHHLLLEDKPEPEPRPPDDGGGEEE